jgi:purine-binding chemotaxis protein CheW
MAPKTSQPATDAGRTGGTQTYCTFRLRSGLFGADTRLIKEVTALPPVTPIPHAPAAVRGCVNLRGHIVLVLDLNCLFERQPTALSQECRLIVFKPEVGESFGALVERVGDIVELPSAQIETHLAGGATSGSPGSSRPEQDLLWGVGKLDGELLMILNAHQLRPCLEHAMACRGQSPTTRRDEVASGAGSMNLTSSKEIIS